MDQLRNWKKQISEGDEHETNNNQKQNYQKSTLAVDINDIPCKNPFLQSLPLSANKMKELSPVHKTDKNISQSQLNNTGLNNSEFDYPTYKTHIHEGNESILQLQQKRGQLPQQPQQQTQINTKNHHNNTAVGNDTMSFLDGLSSNINNANAHQQYDMLGLNNDDSFISTLDHMGNSNNSSSQQFMFNKGDKRKQDSNINTISDPKLRDLLCDVNHLLSRADNTNTKCNEPHNALIGSQRPAPLQRKSQVPVNNCSQASFYDNPESKKIASYVQDRCDQNKNYIGNQDIRAYLKSLESKVGTIANQNSKTADTVSKTIPDAKVKTNSNEQLIKKPIMQNINSQKPILNQQSQQFKSALLLKQPISEQASLSVIHESNELDESKIIQQQKQQERLGPKPKRGSQSRVAPKDFIKEEKRESSEDHVSSDEELQKQKNLENFGKKGKKRRHNNAKNKSSNNNGSSSASFSSQESSEDSQGEGDSDYEEYQKKKYQKRLCRKQIQKGLEKQYKQQLQRINDPNFLKQVQSMIQSNPSNSSAILDNFSLQNIMQQTITNINQTILNNSNDQCNQSKMAFQSQLDINLEQCYQDIDFQMKQRYGHKIKKMLKRKQKVQSGTQITPNEVNNSVLSNIQQEEIFCVDCETFIPLDKADAHGKKCFKVQDVNSQIVVIGGSKMTAEMQRDVKEGLSVVNEKLSKLINLFNKKVDQLFVGLKALSLYAKMQPNNINHPKTTTGKQMPEQMDKKQEERIVEYFAMVLECTEQAIRNNSNDAVLTQCVDDIGAINKVLLETNKDMVYNFIKISSRMRVLIKQKRDVLSQVNLNKTNIDLDKSGLNVSTFVVPSSYSSKQNSSSNNTNQMNAQFQMQPEEIVSQNKNQSTKQPLTQILNQNTVSAANNSMNFFKHQQQQQLKPTHQQRQNQCNNNINRCNEVENSNPSVQYSISSSNCKNHRKHEKSKSIFDMPSASQQQTADIGRLNENLLDISKINICSDFERYQSLQTNLHKQVSATDSASLLQNKHGVNVISQPQTQLLNHHKELNHFQQQNTNFSIAGQTQQYQQQQRNISQNLNSNLQNDIQTAPLKQSQNNHNTIFSQPQPQTELENEKEAAMKKQFFMLAVKLKLQFPSCHNARNAQINDFYNEVLQNKIQHGLWVPFLQQKLENMA